MEFFVQGRLHSDSEDERSGPAGTTGAAGNPTPLGENDEENLGPLGKRPTISNYLADVSYEVETRALVSPWGPAGVRFVIGCAPK